MPNCIPLDPKLPANFDITPNDKRSKSQLDAWWDHPYGLTQPDGKIMVRCLNGGSWDRSSFLGVADTYDEACELAEKKQAEWVKNALNRHSCTRQNRRLSSLDSHSDQTTSRLLWVSSPLWKK